MLKRAPAAYDVDFAAWAESQAEALRTGAPIDVENLAEEIESLGKRERRELRSRLNVLMLHVIKWQHQPEQRSRSWAGSILEQQDAINAVLVDSPSLRQYVEPYLTQGYPMARELARLETGIDVLPDDVASVRTAVLDVLRGDTAKYRL